MSRVCRSKVDIAVALARAKAARRDDRAEARERRAQRRVVDALGNVVHLDGEALPAVRVAAVRAAAMRAGVRAAAGDAGRLSPWIAHRAALRANRSESIERQPRGAAAASAKFT